jgi:hypothetical protein
MCKYVKEKKDIEERRLDFIGSIVYKDDQGNNTYVESRFEESRFNKFCPDNKPYYPTPSDVFCIESHERFDEFAKAYLHRIPMYMLVSRSEKAGRIGDPFGFYIHSIFVDMKAAIERFGINIAHIDDEKKSIVSVKNPRKKAIRPSDEDPGVQSPFKKHLANAKHILNVDEDPSGYYIQKESDSVYCLPLISMVKQETDELRKTLELAGNTDSRREFMEWMKGDSDYNQYLTRHHDYVKWVFTPNNMK